MALKVQVCRLVFLPDIKLGKFDKVCLKILIILDIDKFSIQQNTIA